MSRKRRSEPTPEQLARIAALPPTDNPLEYDSVYQLIFEDYHDGAWGNSEIQKERKLCLCKKCQAERQRTQPESAKLECRPKKKKPKTRFEKELKKRRQRLAAAAKACNENSRVPIIAHSRHK